MSIILYTFVPVMEKPILVFDLGGVLMTHNRSAYIDAMEQLLGREIMQRLGMDTKGENTDYSLIADYECGEIESADFIGKICAMAHHRIRPMAMIHAWNMLHGGIPQSRIDCLKQLREEGYRLYLLSNNNELRWHHTCSEYPELPQLFDSCFLSHEMHCLKPGRQIYEQTDRLIRPSIVSPSSVIFIDDIAENRLAAEQFVGWRTCSSIDELLHILRQTTNM